MQRHSFVETARSIATDARDDPWTYAFYTLATLVMSAPIVALAAVDLAAYDAALPHVLPELNNHTMPDAASFGLLGAWLAFVGACMLALQWVFDGHDETGRPEAYVRAAYDSAVLYALGGVRDKLWHPPAPFPPASFLGLVVGFLLAYSTAFGALEMPKAKEDRTALAPGKLGGAYRVLFFIVPAALVIAVVAVYHLMTAWRVSPAFFGLYLGVALLWIVGHVALACVARQYELHHWYLGLFGAHASLFNTWPGLVCQAAFLALYIHGMGVYGPTPVFAHAPLSSKRTAKVEDAEEPTTP